MELKSPAGVTKVIEEVKRGKFFPVYLVYGEENFLVKEAAQKITEAILPGKEGLGLETFEGDAGWDRAIASLRTYPFFGSKRVVFVKETEIFHSRFVLEDVLNESRGEFERGRIADAVKLFRMALGYLKIEEVTDGVDRELENLADYRVDPEGQKWVRKMVEECVSQDLRPVPYEDHSDQLSQVLREGIPQGNVLLLCTDSVDKRKRLYKTINELGIIMDLSIQRTRRDPVEIDEEEKRTLRQEADELLRKSNKVFGPGAFDTMANKTGYHVGIFLNELGKVILSLRERRIIEVKDIEETVGRTKEDSIFDLQKAVGQRDLGKSFFYLNELLGQGEFYLTLLQAIANEIRSLIAAKELMENPLRTSMNRPLDSETFRRSVYFPIILKMRKEREEQNPAFKKSRYNILKLPPDVLLELLKASENFTREELYRAMKVLAQTDLRTKRTGLAPVRLLEKALTEICGMKETGKRRTGLPV